MIGKKRILVTGAAGSVGLEVIRELVSRPEEFIVTAFDRDTRVVRKKLKPYRNQARIHLGDLRYPQLVNCMSQEVDAVIHLAAIIPPLADEYPEHARKINTIGTRRLIKALEKNSPDAFFRKSVVAGTNN